MAYFSNGTEGYIYEQVWCSRCHFQPRDELKECPIMYLHAVYNYDQCGKDERAKDLKSCLSNLIPRGENGFADKCNFFIEKERHKQEGLF